MHRDNTIQAGIRDRIREQRDEGLEVKRVSPALDPQIKRDILKTGCVIAGSGGGGKTNLAKVICRELIKDENIQLKIFDKAQNWIHNFEPILFQDLDVKILENRGFYFDDQSILFNCRINTPVEIKQVISDVVSYDYDYHWELKKIAQMNRWIGYVIEEAQNVLGTIGLNDIWNTFISEGRNFNMSFMFLTRRMAQLSPKAREQVQSYIWCRTVGQLDLDRVAKIAGKEVAAMLPTLDVGEFVYYNGENSYKLVDVPLYEAVDEPVRWQP